MARRKTLEEFIRDAVAVHGDRYDYSLADYKNSYTKIKIICDEHGIFEQAPMNHLTGYDCHACGHERMRIANQKPVEQFIQESIAIHKDIYDYSSINYINSHTKIKIICKKHGIFEQSPLNHLKGCGCPNCTKNISKPEQQWLESIGLPNNNEHRQVHIKINDILYIVDGYDPTSNTVYEFYGDYWHGNPNVYNMSNMNKVVNKSFGALYEDTIYKESLIKKSGYILIVMWENEWNKKSPY